MIDARLNRILSLCNKSKHTLDCGTDHGKLAVELVKNGVADVVTASDINELPLKKARDLVIKLNLEDKINIALADGVSDFASSDIDQIIIAGMGGELIRDIIDRAGWVRTPSVRMILQPMTTSAALREYLFLNGFRIESESAVCVGNKSYEIIVTSFDGNVREYSFVDIELGDYINQERTKDNLAILLKKRKSLSNRLIGAEKNDTDAADEIKRAIECIDNYIKE